MNKRNGSCFLIKWHLKISSSIFFYLNKAGLREKVLNISSDKSLAKCGFHVNNEVANVEET
jgi:hypothetical protein